MEDLTTFDPSIVEGTAEIYYDELKPGWGDICDRCPASDWQGFLGDAVTIEDWEEVMFNATPLELKQIGEQLGSARARGEIPAAYTASSLWKDGNARPKLRAAVELLQLARDVEALSDHPRWRHGDEKPAPKPKARLDKRARAGMAATRDPFLAQRYAFQLTRILYYQNRSRELIDFVEGEGKEILSGPSSALLWRARYYLMGALIGDMQWSRSLLELARVHVGSMELAGPTAADFATTFASTSDELWQETLAMATSVQDKVALWRLVGVTKDGLVAMQEIFKLDPKSPHLALLMVRELSRSEWWSDDADSDSAMTPDVRARQRREMARLAHLATAIAASPGADQPWRMKLMAGHLLARVGELTAARQLLLEALEEHPNDEKVRTQAHASLAMALLTEARLDEEHDHAPHRPTRARAEEMAAEMLQVSDDFGRMVTLRRKVRGGLARAYLAAGRLVLAELLQPTILAEQPETFRSWKDPEFLRAMIAQASKRATALDRFLVHEEDPGFVQTILSKASTRVTPFDRFLEQDEPWPWMWMWREMQPHSRAKLERDLAMYYLTQGSFAEAAEILVSGRAESKRLGTNPFEMPLVDDYEQDESTPWTHASFAERLVELEQQANGTGEPAAEAALELGTALYNISFYGNARVVLRGTHQKIYSPLLAMRWFQRVLELSRDRQRRARAVFYLAKAELATLLSDTSEEEMQRENPSAIWRSGPLPVPTTWFSVLETYSDTTYYREVLAECSNFRRWVELRAKETKHAR